MSALVYTNIRKFVHALEVLDDLVLRASYDSIRLNPNGSVAEGDLRLLEASRGEYRKANYNAAHMLSYLEKLQERARAWDSAMTAILEMVSYSKVASRETSALNWERWLMETEKAGGVAWRLAIPTAKTLTGGAGTLNAIVSKFAALDNVLDEVHSQLGEDGFRERFSDEMRDTLLALKEYYQSVGGGPHQPNPTPEQLQAFKTELRNRRAKSLAESPCSEEAGRDRRGQRVPAAEVLQTQKWRIPLPTLVTAVSFISAVPGYIAWTHSSHERGTFEDANFWFLVQRTIIHLLGLITIMTPWLATSAPSNHFSPWTWRLIRFSILCYIGAIPAYVYFSTAWSATIDFAGTMAQVFALQETSLAFGRVGSLGEY